MLRVEQGELPGGLHFKKIVYWAHGSKGVGGAGVWMEREGLFTKDSLSNKF